ncbi:phosphate-repressible phosphate permease [Cladochytrium replicatum]|nr:phosphate-repressible phosphate permease [Cladochytrium replicatum]
MLPYDFTWIFALTVCFAIFDAYGIGANDVANSFATSVGSRSLKLWQAVVIALFTEAGGAMLLGAGVTDTIKDGIIVSSGFAKRPELLMQGFMSALIASSSWVMFATYLGLPVSTTHSIVGAVVGMGISAFGTNSVKWEWAGIGKIIASWFISPVLAGLIAALIYLISKYAVFRAKNTLRNGILAIPWYFAFTLTVMMYYIVSKNGKYKPISVSADVTTGVWKITGDWASVGAAIGATFGGVLLICFGFVVPFFIRLLEKEEDLKWYHIFYIWLVPTQPVNTELSARLRTQFTPDHVDAAIENAEAGEETVEKKETVEAVADTTSAPPAAATTQTSTNFATGAYNKVKGLLYNSLFMDVASIQSASAKTAHDAAVRYDNKTEYLYSFLQVCTAAFASLAHGSNDVANAIGPLAAVYQIWQTASVTSKVDVPFWMLAVGGIAIDLGLALYGYNIMKNLGNNMTYHSPSRGFSMELGAALTVITASFLGLPVSTTHCITGATVGVGLCNGNLAAINWKLFAWCFFGWIFTVPFAGACSGLLYALFTRGASFSYGGF